MTPLEDYYNLHFENVWGRDASPYQELILEMWTRNGGPVGPEAEKRLKQLVFVMRKDGGDVVGVSTAFKAYVKQLRNYMFVVRPMITPEHEAPGLSSRLLVSTRDFLESLHDQEGLDEPIGILTLVQKDRSSNITSEAIWPASKMVYIGNTARGHHIRVYYFKGARITP